MKVPKSEIEKAKSLLEDYKKRVEKGEKFPTWEEVERELDFTEKETLKMEKKMQKIRAKIEKRDARLAKKRKKRKQSNGIMIRI